MPPGDPRRATVITTWAIRGDKIYFDETGQYQFVREEGTCSASVRRTRVLERSTPAPNSAAVGEQPKAPTKADPNPNPTQAEKPEATAKAPTQDSPSALVTSLPRCSQGSRPVSLTLTPDRALALPGEKIALEIEARGPKGCLFGATEATVVATLREGGELLRHSSLLFEVPTGVRTGTAAFEANLGGVRAEAQVAVVGREDMETLFQADSPSPTSEPRPKTNGEPAPVEQNIQQQVAPSPSSGALPLIWRLATLAGLVVTAGAAGILWWRHNRARRPGSAPQKHTLPSAQSPAAKVCPVCGAPYPSGAEYCGKDGARLQRASRTS